MQWVDIDYIVFSFLPRKNTAMDNIITICDLHVNQIRANIDMGNEINQM
jgi:hypothetical protein